MRILQSLLAVIVTAWLSGCAPGDGSGLADNGRPLDEAGASVPLAPTLESLQANLFDINCAVSGCHSGSNAPLGLDLSSGNSYANLVSRASAQQPARLRIAPGDADGSYLVHKVEGAAGISGERMPRGRGRLEQSLIDTLRQWIDQGAPATSAGASNAPVVSSSSITANSGVSALPVSLQLVFNQALNPVTVVSGTLSLQASGGDAVFDDGNEVDLVVQPSLSADGRTLTLDLSSNPQVGDSSINEDYRLVVSGSGLAAVRSSEEIVLDGDNDGEPGGDYLLQFYTGSVLRPTLASLEANLFVPNCAKSGCHAGSNPVQGMNLEAGNVYANTVRVTSNFIPSTQRIVPGNADASAIVQALEGSVIAIPRMPFDNPGGISQADIDVLRQWINAGANP